MQVDRGSTQETCSLAENENCTFNFKTGSKRLKKLDLNMGLDINKQQYIKSSQESKLSANTREKLISTIKIQTRMTDKNAKDKCKRRSRVICYKEA